MSNITDEQHPQFLDELEKERQQYEANKPTNLPPCPEWCVLPEGHDIDGHLTGDPDVYFRDHLSTNDADAWVVQEEQHRGGEVTLGQPAVRSLEIEFYPGVDSTRARHAARELLEAADLLDRINGVDVPGEDGAVAAAYRLGYEAGKGDAQSA